MTLLLLLTPFHAVVFAACLHPFVHLITGVTPPLHGFSLAVGEGVLSVAHLSEIYLSLNRKVTASWKEMDTTVDGKLGYFST